MVNIKKFDEESLLEVIDLYPNETFTDPEGNTFRLIKIEKNVGTNRWSAHHRMIFEFNDVLYASEYSTGLTEYQDETPYENNEPVGYRVEPTEVSIIKYVKVK